jgi:hypothetical protein
VDILKVIQIEGGETPPLRLEDEKMYLTGAGIVVKTESETGNEILSLYRNYAT